MNTEKIIIKSVFPYDHMANMIVRLVLKKRGSKPIFTNSEVAKKELERIGKTNQDEYTLPEKAKITNNLEEGKFEGFPLYTITPKKLEKTKKVVLYLHGGAFVNQPEWRHYNMVDDLVSFSGCTLKFFVYPKAPTHDYKLGCKLIEELYLKLLEENEPENIIFMGDSAGAMLSVTMCQIFREKGIPQPSQLILYSLVADTKLAHPEIREIEKIDPMQGVDGLTEYAKVWAKDIDIESPIINPIATDLSKLPKTTIFGGTVEIFNPDVRVFTEKANELGADVTFYQYKGLYHCFVLFDQIAAYGVRKRTAKLINS